MTGAALLATLAASALVTSFISGILGMAGGMVLMGILLALLPVPAAMMLHGITQLASNAWRAWLWRREVDWRTFRGYCVGALAALALFASVQLVLSKDVALIVLGLTPFVVLWLPERLVLDVRRRGHPFACGAICQGLNLTAGVSGPILDVFFVRSPLSRQAVVATKALTQGASHLAKIAYFGALLGLAGGDVDYAAAALMVVLAFTGTTLSRSVLENLEESSFRKWTRWTVLATGAFYLASGAWLFASR